ncbi:hypothetical protein UlMin_005958 [Ulmus minor]
MYLDNSGEAYFVKEVDAGKGVEANGVSDDSDNAKVTGEDSIINGDKQHNGNELVDIRRFQHSVSDSRVVQLRNDGGEGLQRAQSDSDRRFYEFQDDQSSIEGSVELSEYGEDVVESQNLDSEVVLVSVDGHILTAPISASEQNTENLQLDTPQFHLGPGEGTEFCDGNDEFNTGEDSWAVDYLSKLKVSTTGDASNSDAIVNGDNSCAHQLEVCEGEGKYVSQVTETLHISAAEGDSEVALQVKKEEFSENCLTISETPMQVKNADFRDLGSFSEVQSSPQTHHTPPAADKNKEDDAVLKNNDVLSPLSSSDFPNNDVSQDVKPEAESVEKKEDGAEDVDIEEGSLHSVSENPEWKDEQFGVESTPERPTAEDESLRNEQMEPSTTTSTGEIQTRLNISLEISLCGNKLYAGMGLDVAAEVFDAHRISAEEFKSSAASIVKNANLIIRYRGRYFPWEKAAHLALGMAAFGLDMAIEAMDAIPVEQDGTPKPRSDESGLESTPSGRRWRLWFSPFRSVKTLEHTTSNSSNEDEFVDSESVLHNSTIDTTPTSSQSFAESPRKQFVRTNVPTTEQIASLNLKDGQNLITFSFSTRVLGRQQVDAHIYLWKWNARIVISDVDGTITKSDVLGQFMPLVGKDWTQSGVAKLFSAIKENGYQLLFLSARAIVQAYLTRSFLLNLKQDGNTLPNGPVVISPDGLFPSLYREVIRRAPHEFKIACLEDIKKLFPSDYNPFYAGFGNRDTDELSYRKIGIPKGKIFIINPKGEVAISHRIDVKSYTSLHTLVDDMFPPTSLLEQEDFNSWNFWRMPLPEVDE